MQNMMYNVVWTICLSNYIENIIDYVLCFTTTHFLCNPVTITQTVSPFSSTTYKYNLEIKCYIMIVTALEIIYIYQYDRTVIKFIILKCILLQYSKQYSLDNNQCT